MSVKVAVVEKIIDKVFARVRIPNIHGEKGKPDSVPTDYLPLAYPCISPAYWEDENNAYINIGDKLYVLEVNRDYYIYLGKEYEKSFYFGKDKSIYVENRGTDYEDGFEETQENPRPDVETFSGFYLNSDPQLNILEIISAIKQGSSLSDYSSIKLDANNGIIRLLVKKNNNKCIIELNSNTGNITLKTVQNGNVYAKIEITDLIKLISTGGGLEISSNGIEEVNGESSTDSTEWDGKVL